MRISDWSSDVCSSDLRAVDVIALATQQRDTLLAFLDRDQALQLAAVADVVKVDHLTDVGEAEAGALGPQYPGEKSEERRVGKECVRTCRFQLLPVTT